MWVIFKAVCQSLFSIVVEGASRVSEERIIADWMKRGVGWAAASDIALALYPLIVYRNLNVSLKVRVAMYILFGGGIL